MKGTLLNVASNRISFVNVVFSVDTATDNIIVDLSYKSRIS